MKEPRSSVNDEELGKRGREKPQHKMSQVAVGNMSAQLVVGSPPSPDLPPSAWPTLLGNSWSIGSSRDWARSLERVFWRERWERRAE